MLRIVYCVWVHLENASLEWHCVLRIAYCVSVSSLFRCHCVLRIAYCVLRIAYCVLVLWAPFRMTYIALMTMVQTTQGRIGGPRTGWDE